MPWVRGHYARSPRAWGRYGALPTIAAIVLIVIVVVLLFGLLTS
jgi:hypothetical protein